MNKIGIIQVDGKMPNLALMQICQYHESKGDFVENWKGPLFNSEYDTVYASKIFSFSDWPQGMPQNTILGGTGVDWKNRLPDEIAACPPSYSLYPDCDYHLGFSMKGCRFACKFCVVPQKEGKPWSNSTISDLLRNEKGGNRLMLLDNDFFGGPRWADALKEIFDLKLKVCFVQGLNIRILTEEQAELLSQVKYYNSRFKKRILTFAWDRPNFKRDEKLIFEGISNLERFGVPPSHLQFFVLIGYDSTPEQDMYRVMKLKDAGCRPFVMPYNKSDPYQRAFARWVNHTATFHSCSWEEYKYNPKTRLKHATIFRS